MNSHGHIDSSSKIRRLIVLFAVHMFMTAYNVIYMRADNRADPIICALHIGKMSFPTPLCLIIHVFPESTVF